MDTLVGEASPNLVQFIVDGEFVVPSSASYSVRDNAGAVLAGLSDVAISLGATDTQATITVAADKNTVANGLMFENRTVTGKFTHEGNIYPFRYSYRVLPFLNHTVTPDDVRSVLGVLKHEISDDEDIDLTASYYLVQERVGASALTTALAAGDLTTQYANWAIMYRAAMDLVSSLQLRAAVAQGDDNITFERFAKIDWQALWDSLNETYEGSIWSMIPVADRPLVVQPLALVVSAPTDVITGV
jgi:hypothetical protein